MEIISHYRLKNSSGLPVLCCGAFGVRSCDDLAGADAVDGDAFGVDFVGGRILVGGLIGLSFRS